MSVTTTNNTCSSLNTTDAENVFTLVAFYVFNLFYFPNVFKVKSYINSVQILRNSNENIPEQ